MKKFKLVRKPTLLEVLLSLIILGIVIYNGMDYLTSLNQAQAKEHDAVRISDLGQIQAALLQYYTDHDNTYPPCLYKSATCAFSLEGMKEMPIVPKDPQTNIGYSFAAYGTGATCTGYHLGISLERTGSQALLTGSDAATEPTNKLCTTSAPDFSGLSYEKGGQPCSIKVGTAQPTDNADGETCYDIARHRQTK